jgi:pyruvate,water dikinase
MQYIKFFDEVNLNDIMLVGGKNASLGEMTQNLTTLGINVPYGFALTSEAYWLMLKENHLEKKIKKILIDVDIDNIKSLAKKGGKVRQLLLQNPLPLVVQDEIKQAYKQLKKHHQTKNLKVAVRSSGTAEDLPSASFAGQQETYLNIEGTEAIINHVHQCYASLFTNRAISYRQSRDFSHFDVAISVGVQTMIQSQSSGVMFTLDTQTGTQSLVMINAIWGLGENMVGGKVNPDEYLVFKPTLALGHDAIIKRTLGLKQEKMLYKKNTTINVPCTTKERQQFALNDQTITTLAQHGIAIEHYYSQRAGKTQPMDIEWAQDSTGQLYILQARPETIQSQHQNKTLQKYQINSKDAKILLTGRAIGQKVGVGKVRKIASLKEASSFKEGEILVTDITDPDWEPLMKKAAAVITNKGGRTCHAAIVAREIGVPSIVGCNTATGQLKTGQQITISCAEGEEGYVYEGTIPFTIETLTIDIPQETKTKIFMNVGDPNKAFKFAQLPNDGVGLARMEFIINNAIKAHPMALIDMYKGKKVTDHSTIKTLTQGYKDTKTFFIERLSEGIATIAAAFYPKPVIVRTSDFKSNEYKHMIGGNVYEQDEENPMIGFRGASRYYSKSYQKAFEWECQALKKVRDDMGLTNIKIMLPFVRTPEEGQKVISIMNKQGLIQGKNQLEIYAMCEIPSNVLFAEAFLKIFDGYSIGSNDLTQLTLGVDRDSQKVAHIFDERNTAVKRMIKLVIDACKKEDKYIGICGQAPSDYPEMTAFLVKQHIDSISLNPDSLLSMRTLVASLEKE